MKKNKLKTWIIISFWFLIALINTSQNLLSIYVNQYKLGFVQILFQQIGWLIWIGFTPFVLRQGDKIPIGGTIRYYHLIKKYFVFSVLISLAHFLCESVLVGSLYLIIMKTLPPGKYFAGLIAYKFHLHLFICFLLLSISYALNYFNRYKTSEIEKAKLELNNEQLKNQLSQAKLMSLKMQIQPHFLFNTHNTISSLILENKNEEAVKMIVKLSDMLRLTLENGSEDMVPLCRELEIIKLYLSIHESRFIDRLKVFYNINPGTEHLLIPAMIMQPLIENAIKHGLSKSSLSGIIEVAVYTNEDKIYIKISNTGSELSLTAKEGTGLKITRERLKHIYKDSYYFALYSYGNKTISELQLPMGKYGTS